MTNDEIDEIKDKLYSHFLLTYRKIFFPLLGDFSIFRVGTPGKIKTVFYKPDRYNTKPIINKSISRVKFQGITVHDSCISLAKELEEVEREYWKNYAEYYMEKQND